MILFLRNKDMRTSWLRRIQLQILHHLGSAGVDVVPCLKTGVRELDGCDANDGSVDRVERECELGLLASDEGDEPGEAGESADSGTGVAEERVGGEVVKGES